MPKWIQGNLTEKPTAPILPFKSHWTKDYGFITSCFLRVYRLSVTTAKKTKFNSTSQQSSQYLS